MKKVKKEEAAMLKEMPACVIRDYSGLEKELKKSRPSEKQREKIAYSVNNIDEEHLRKVFLKQ